MKKMIFTLMAFLTIAVNANAMSYEQAREEALFLTDKMAYELNLTDAQYEAAYEINLDYLMGVTSEYDVYGPYWERRNLDLSYILFSWQWDLYRAATYFYRPLFWERGYWHFGIYARYPHRDYFYFGRPHFYTTYRGGHSWRMNNGRSFYEGRRDFYRPNHITRDTHFGMRSGWDRGDYRPQPNGGGHPSSTHITGGRGNGLHGNGNWRDGGNRGSFGGNGNRGGSFDNSNRGGNRGGSFDNSNRGGNRGGSFDGGNRGGNRGGSFDGGNRGGNTGGSFDGGNRGGNTGGSFDGGNRGGNTGGSFNGGNRGGNTGGSFGNGGNRGGSVGNGGGSGSFGGSRSSGSFSGSRSTGGPTRSGSVGGGSSRGGNGGGGHRGGFGGSRR